MQALVPEKTKRLAFRAFLPGKMLDPGEVRAGVEIADDCPLDAPGPF